MDCTRVNSDRFGFTERKMKRRKGGGRTNEADGVVDNGFTVTARPWLISC